MEHEATSLTPFDDAERRVTGGRRVRRTSHGLIRRRCRDGVDCAAEPVECMRVWVGEPVAADVVIDDRIGRTLDRHPEAFFAQLQRRLRVSIFPAVGRQAVPERVRFREALSEGDAISQTRALHWQDLPVDPPPWLERAP